MNVIAWQRMRSRDGDWVRVPGLWDAGLLHGFSCRSLGETTDAGRSPGAAIRALARALGWSGMPRAALRQEHTAVVHRVTGPTSDRSLPVGDALVTTSPGVALTLLTADCVPLLAFCDDPPALAAVHAGWRGTLLGVLEGALGALVETLGVPPSRLRVLAGPAIRVCCYEVGPEVEDAFRARWPAASGWLAPGPRGRPHLDLAAANFHQAARAGVAEDRLHDPGWCTRCRRDLFYSRRADGAGTGRMVTLAALPGGDFPSRGDPG